MKIKALRPRKKPFRVCDGDGLYLHVTPTGRKSWQVRYRFAGKERMISGGGYPRVSLKEARDLRHRTKQLLDLNIDPCSEKQRQKLEAKFRDQNSFQRVAAEWFNSRKAEWTPRHARKIWHRLERYVFPDLGRRAIAEIKPLEVLRVIQKIETRDATELSHCQLSVCNRIFRYGIVTGRLHYNPASDLGPALRRHRVRHHPSLRPNELGEFLRQFQTLECKEVHKIAFELLLLTGLRTGELRHSKWGDIDFARWEWVLPSEITKMKEEHVVPLSDQAAALLRRLKDLTGDQKWLFPNQDPRKHPVISENFANNIIRKMGYEGKVVGHGFRSMFSTVLNEAGFNRDAVERQLAHKERNRVRAAYNRAEYWEIRGPMMQWWADFLDKAMRSDPRAGRGRSLEGFIMPAVVPGRIELGSCQPPFESGRAERQRLSRV
ncbi:tyrosine-type recombinase/integrase [Luteolibacter ambystomatis]|uniref:Tyrosine-type recombinase/integrase n=1 Tax=Luteolibacter ambystomatis TaxID=2824561 RepID=A0A975J1E2_9BACT|nr:tyrosine-type recombinase/integrase [Luteolibacter ambystomatis]QUE52248.1 tyrosine-type recombinase/integrase [Luteolibacter ambystomatis]